LKPASCGFLCIYQNDPWLLRGYRGTHNRVGKDLRSSWVSLISNLEIIGAWP
jgi:hypothetical protein